MSVHRSLKHRSDTDRSRNVYSRWERLQKLQEKGRWNNGDTIYGLPKVRTGIIKK